MTVEELKDEIEAIDAIYPQSTEFVTAQVYTVTLPEHRAIQLQLSFPESYPDEIPNLIQVISKDLKRYSDTMYFETKVKSLLTSTFVPGVVCIFEILSELELFMEAYDATHLQRLQEMKSNAEEKSIEEGLERVELKPTDDTVEYTAGWIQSDPITDRGSTFIGFARECNSVIEAREYVNFLTQDRKIARASHNINSWRIKNGDVLYQDCDDDGETAAGGRLLHLLTVCI